MPEEFERALKNLGFATKQIIFDDLRAVRFRKSFQNTPENQNRFVRLRKSILIHARGRGDDLHRLSLNEQKLDGKRLIIAGKAIFKD